MKDLTSLTLATEHLKNLTKARVVDLRYSEQSWVVMVESQNKMHPVPTSYSQSPLAAIKKAIKKAQAGDVFSY